MQKPACGRTANGRDKALKGSVRMQSENPEDVSIDILEGISLSDDDQRECRATHNRPPLAGKRPAGEMGVTTACKYSRVAENGRLQCSQKLENNGTSTMPVKRTKALLIVPPGENAWAFQKPLEKLRNEYHTTKSRRKSVEDDFGDGLEISEEPNIAKKRSVSKTHKRKQRSCNEANHRSGGDERLQRAKAYVSRKMREASNTLIIVKGAVVHTARSLRNSCVSSCDALLRTPPARYEKVDGSVSTVAEKKSKDGTHVTKAGDYRTQQQKSFLTSLTHTPLRRLKNSEKPQLSEHIFAYDDNCNVKDATCRVCKPQIEELPTATLRRCATQRSIWTVISRTELRATYAASQVAIAQEPAQKLLWLTALWKLLSLGLETGNDSKRAKPKVDLAALRVRLAAYNTGIILTCLQLLEEATLNETVQVGSSKTKDSEMCSFAAVDVAKNDPTLTAMCIRVLHKVCLNNAAAIDLFISENGPSVVVGRLKSLFFNPGNNSEIKNPNEMEIDALKASYRLLFSTTGSKSVDASSLWTRAGILEFPKATSKFGTTHHAAATSLFLTDVSYVGLSLGIVAVLCNREDVCGDLIPFWFDFALKNWLNYSDAWICENALAVLSVTGSRMPDRLATIFEEQNIWTGFLERTKSMSKCGNVPYYALNICVAAVAASNGCGIAVLAKLDMQQWVRAMLQGLPGKGSEERKAGSKLLDVLKRAADAIDRCEAQTHAEQAILNDLKMQKRDHEIAVQEAAKIGQEAVSVLKNATLTVKELELEKSAIETLIQRTEKQSSHKCAESCTIVPCSPPCVTIVNNENWQRVGEGPIAVPLIQVCEEIVPEPLVPSKQELPYKVILSRNRPYVHDVKKKRRSASVGKTSTLPMETQTPVITDPVRSQDTGLLTSELGSDSAKGQSHLNEKLPIVIQAEYPKGEQNVRCTEPSAEDTPQENLLSDKTDTASRSTSTRENQHLRTECALSCAKTNVVILQKPPLSEEAKKPETVAREYYPENPASCRSPPSVGSANASDIASALTLESCKESSNTLHPGVSCSSPAVMMATERKQHISLSPPQCESGMWRLRRQNAFSHEILDELVPLPTNDSAVHSARLPGVVLQEQAVLAYHGECGVVALDSYQQNSSDARIQVEKAPVRRLRKGRRRRRQPVAYLAENKACGQPHNSGLNGNASRKKRNTSTL